MKDTLSWSGGKDSCLALHLAKENADIPVILLSMMNESGNYSRSNGVHKSVLEAQAESLELVIEFVSTSWGDYQAKLTDKLKGLRKKLQIEGVVFGDIDTNVHREFNEHICREANLVPVMPLWNLSRKQVIEYNKQLKIQSKVCVINKHYNCEDLLGEDFNDLNFSKLQDLGMDECGENGEFHTVVYDAPLFKYKLNLSLLETHDLSQVKLAEYRFLE